MTRTVRPLGAMTEHYWLAKKMAKASGADLVQAFADDRLSSQDWSDIVQRCRGCDWAQQCQCWLGQTEWGDQTVPSVCANSEMLERLKPGDNTNVADR